MIKCINHYKNIGKWSGMKIRTRVILVYLSVLLFSLLLSLGLFGLVNNRYAKKEIESATMQTINALEGNLNLIFDNVMQFSNLIYFDKTVQNSLAGISDRAIDPKVNQSIQKSLVNMLLSGEYIESVFIFDKYFNSYYSHKVGPIMVDNDKAVGTYWYQEAQKLNGDILFVQDTEGVIHYPTRPDKRCITLVRTIADVNTYEKLATLMINVDETTIQKYFDSVGAEYHSRFCIVDGQGDFVVRPAVDPDEMGAIIARSGLAGTGFTLLDQDGGETIVAQKEMGIQDWRLVEVMPMEKSASMKAFQTSLFLILVFLNVLVVAVCSITLQNMIFKPLGKVQDYMEMVENEQFEEIAVDEQLADEISSLKKVFNSMVRAIQNLIEKVKAEEKTIARNELDIIQAQVNPHFLYNTLDAVSALALIGDNENCLKMTQALGDFYRNSLNSGRDLITVEEEIKSIRSYITILNIRHNDTIRLICEIEEQILRKKILKLILQPIVENAVQHGLRCKGGKGTVTISGYRDEGELIFIVTDDGAGMSEDRVRDLMKGKGGEGHTGFGLYSAMSRISLYYDIEKPITITSEVGSGTEVTICVNVLEGIEDDEDQGIDRR